MKKVIANAVFKVNDKFKGVNVSSSNNMDVYLKNSFVSLYSAKKYNPDAEVILFTNYEISVEYKKIFANNSIKIKQINEVKFKFPENFKWAPAFFKLDVLDYLKNNYDLICVLDTDTIFVGDCKYMWKESESNILIFDVDYSLESKKRKITIDLANNIFKKDESINHWGGEIIIGSSNNINILLEECKNIYDKLIKKIDSIDTGFGQEALLSIAISNINSLCLGRANKYCMRYWTRRIYLIDTNYNNIPIWHLPAEKDFGLIKIYNRINNKGKLPSKKYIARKCYLYKKMNIIEKFFYYKKIFISKYKSGQSINLIKKKGWIDK